MASTRAHSSGSSPKRTWGWLAISLLVALAAAHDGDSALSAGHAFVETGPQDADFVNHTSVIETKYMQLRNNQSAYGDEGTSVNQGKFEYPFESKHYFDIIVRAPVQTWNFKLDNDTGWMHIKGDFGFGVANFNSYSNTKIPYVGTKVERRLPPGVSFVNNDHTVRVQRTSQTDYDIYIDGTYWTNFTSYWSADALTYFSVERVDGETNKVFHGGEIHTGVTHLERCSRTLPSRRQRCGAEDISMPDCQSRFCCYDTSSPIKCFYPAQNPYTPGEYEHKGCFSDSGGFDVSRTPGEITVNSPAHCAYFCWSRVPGASVFALSHDKCKCGIDYGHLGQLAASDCNTNCPGDASKTCGSADANDVYTFKRLSDSTERGALQDPSTMPGARPGNVWNDQGYRLASGGSTGPFCDGQAISFAVVPAEAAKAGPYLEFKLHSDSEDAAGSRQHGFAVYYRASKAKLKCAWLSAAFNPEGARASMDCAAIPRDAGGRPEPLRDLTLVHSNCEIGIYFNGKRLDSTIPTQLLDRYTRASTTVATNRISLRGVTSCPEARQCGYKRE
eukprot:GHVU01218929.1.p1 GENE.GHVU01218929.1~~GHVU01218929.1.p1  ORF type:complete len:559 (+),score=85.29 GHVU01218929.1:200-1876(+)